ncbi:CHAT domain-containing protein [Martelella sp. HB161492]|uniref:CHAT domain-containing protein n=1 Tax=Martelella sp. HB161492 TaxID=2720726 RepID=UPI0015924229|nr:CHAT domain-containing protein [Martelella sp. HB161492]
MITLPCPAFSLPRPGLSILILSLWIGSSVPQQLQAQDFDKGYAAAIQGDFATALQELAPLAEAGEPDAQFVLGALNYNGSGVPKDMTRAESWFLKAAEQGHAPAQFALGVLYRDASSGRQDLARAAYWYRMAAEQGHMQAQSTLGYLYQNGFGVPKNIAEAMRWYLLAAEQGDVLSQRIVALNYSIGNGVPEDMTESRKWQRRAADQGDAAAQYELGRDYETDGDVVQAMHWYQLAARQGEQKAQVRLGFFAYHGLGQAADPAQAALWYHRAAEQGNAEAQSQLGLLYETGQGVTRDATAAADWYQRAEKAGMKTNPERALFFWRKQLRAAEKAEGTDGKAVLEPLWNIALVLTRDPEFHVPQLEQEARAIFGRGTGLSRQLLGPDHPRSLEFAGSYAVALHHAGRNDEALELSRDTVERSRRVLGPTSETTLIRVGTLAAILAARGEQAESYRILLDGIATATRVYGADSSLVTTALGTQVMTLNTDQPDAGLISLFRSAAADSLRENGRTSPKYIYMLGKSAALLEASGRHAEALAVRRDIVAAQQERLLLSSTMDEVLRRAVIGEARAAGTATADAIWAARDALHDGAADTSAGPAEGQDNPQDADLSAEEAFHAVQLGQSGAALAVARSTARLALQTAALKTGFSAFEAAQKRVLALTEATDRALDRRAAGDQIDKDEIRRLQDQRDAAVKTVNARAEALATDFPRFFDMLAPQPVRIAEIRGTDGAPPLLRETEALILLMPPHDEKPGLVWTVSRDKLAWAPISVRESELRADLSLFHRMLSGSGATRPDVVAMRARGAFSLEEDSEGVAGFDRDFAYRLYQKLLGDPALQAVIADKPDWILAPQGMLLSLPFAPLVTAPPPGGRAGDADPAALRSTQWLGARHALSVIPAISSLRALRQATPPAAENPPPRADRSFFGLGDPAFGGRSGADRGQEADDNGDLFRSAVANPDIVRRLPRLPETRREIEKLASVFGASGDALLLGQEASESGLARAQKDGLLPHARVVVMATHGLMAGAFGGLTEPALALSPPVSGAATIAADDAAAAEAGADDDPWIDDGLLTASEVTRLSLDADWVILSACDTAAGEDQTPDAEGLSGLARAFFYAGARSLLVSHWPVRDDAASKLTPLAVSEAEREHVSHAEALRRAMVQVMNDPATDAEGHSLAHPSAWAPFQVTGVDAAE